MSEVVRKQDNVVLGGNLIGLLSDPTLLCSLTNAARSAVVLTPFVMDLAFGTRSRSNLGLLAINPFLLEAWLALAPD